MAQTNLKGIPVHTSGDLPAQGSAAPAFTLVKTDLTDAELRSYAGRRVVLNIFPSLDTAVCATSLRKFNALATTVANTTVLCVSADLPFASKRFCTAEGLENLVPASCFRNPGFGEAYGVRLVDSRMRGLLARAVVVLDEHGKVLHAELVPEISHEPDYEAAVAVLK